MRFISRLFGASSLSTHSESSSAVTEPLNFEIQDGWFVSNADIERLSTDLSSTAYVRLTQSRDSMDDFHVLTVSLTAFQFDCSDLDVAPILILRGRKKGLSASVESYIHLKRKFFRSRGKSPTVRLRLDQDEPITCGENETSYSTDDSSLFFERYDLFQKTLVGNIVRVQIITQRGTPVFMTFDFATARPTFEFFARAILGTDFQSIMTINPEIMNHLMRTGPTHVLNYKKALAALHFNPGPIDYTKGAAFYSAIQAYAIKRHASEIFGLFEGDHQSKKLNHPFSYLLFKEMPARLRHELGPTKLNE